MPFEEKSPQTWEYLFIGLNWVVLYYYYYYNKLNYVFSLNMVVNNGWKIGIEFQKTEKPVSRNVDELTQSKPSKHNMPAYIIGVYYII